MKTDKRRTLLYVRGANSNGTATANYFTAKYRSYTDQADFAPQIRYAEVLLNSAEARLGSGVLPERLIC